MGTDCEPTTYFERLDCECMQLHDADVHYECQYGIWERTKLESRNNQQLVIASCDVPTETVDGTELVPLIPANPNFDFMLVNGASLEVIECQQRLCVLLVTTQDCITSHYNRHVVLP